MNASEIKFSLLKFKRGYYWSKTSHKMVLMDDISTIVWEKEDLPVKMDVMTIKNVIEYVKKNPGDSKKHRNLVMRLISDRFPLKDYVDMSHWNNVIYVDLDMIHSLKFGNLNKEKRKLLYEQLDYALQNICPNNYFYIEHSSSGIGIHCMFCFDCEPSERNYKKYAKYIYEIFRYKIDDYIKEFSSIFTETDGGKVFDPVYERPYQKLYITGIDSILYNSDGNCENIVYENEDEIIEDEIKKDISNGTFDVKFVTKKKKYDTSYYDRLYIITALKKYVGDYDKCKLLWYQLCENLTLYKNYTTSKFKNMLELNWNKIKSETGHIEILKKYGFNVDENNLHIHLKDNEYISDVIDDIINFSGNGLNLLNSGTGSGKTEAWKKWWINLSDIFSLINHKSILIVEPMNSIIESKYDKEIFEIVTGSKRINIGPIPKCYITNYNHLIKQTFEGNTPREDIDKFFGQFELIIIDESHIMMKDTFRSDVLIPFMQTLNKINNTKVILQTASPLFEQSTLHIMKTITIHKKEKAKVKVIYRQAPDKFNIGHIICLVNYYVSNGKKTYIYWKDGSLQNMNFIKKIYPDAMVIYHKRDIDSDDMKYINENHNLGKCNVMISSVYFGVGNDLNDEIDDAAVIIIGNNVWQEDIQAKGRWRNAKNIELCIITLPHEKEFIENSKKTTFNWSDRYNMHKSIYSTIYNDALNREKSIIIGGKAFAIKDKNYIEYLAKMKTANEYSCQLYEKNKQFINLGYDVRDDIKPLLTNKDWEDELKKFRDDLKNVRNSKFKDFLNDKYEWETINKDSSLDRCARIIRKLQKHSLIEYCNLDKFIKSKIYRYETFLRYYQMRLSEKYDFAELFSLLWVRNEIKKHDKNDTIKYKEYELKCFDYYCFCGYLIWLSYRNKDDKKDYINGSYFNNFIHNVNDFCELEDRLINRLFVKYAYDETYNSFMEEFLGTKIEKSENIEREKIIEYIAKITLNDEYLTKVMKYISEYIMDKNVKGKIGGKKSNRKTKCIITDKFKFLEKYNLSVNQEFESCSALAEYVKKSLQTISSWKSKSWIK